MKMAPTAAVLGYIFHTMYLLSELRWVVAGLAQGRGRERLFPKPARPGRAPCLHQIEARYKGKRKITAASSGRETQERGRIVDSFGARME